jgi:hypothetical protein
VNALGYCAQDQLLWRCLAQLGDGELIPSLKAAKKAVRRTCLPDTGRGRANLFHNIGTGYNPDPTVLDTWLYGLLSSMKNKGK